MGARGHLGDVYHENERQFSAYNYEVADTALLAAEFDAHEAEAGRCLEAGLPLAAYDQVLKCSHAFNLLDARRRDRGHRPPGLHPADAPADAGCGAGVPRGAGG